MPTIKLRNSKSAQSDNLIYVKKVEKKIYKEEKAQINQEKTKTKQRRVLWLNVITVDIIDY